MAYWWKAPNMRGRLPPKKAVDLELPTLTDRMIPAETCLLYGGAGDIVRPWLLVERKTQESQESQSPDCTREFVQGKAEEFSVDNIQISVVNYWPFDNRDPDRTLLEFNDIVGIAVEGRQLLSYVNYKMVPYKNSEGKPSDVTFTPAFIGDSEKLVGAFRETNKNFVRGTTEGSISFNIGEVDRSRLGELPRRRLIYTSYDVHDVKGDVVASIPIPVFLPTQ